MGAGVCLLFLPVVLGVPFACVGVILMLCEWSWGKPVGSMGSTGILAGFGLLCLATILLVWLIVCLGGR